MRQVLERGGVERVKGALPPGDHMVQLSLEHDGADLGLPCSVGSCHGGPWQYRLASDSLYITTHVVHLHKETSYIRGCNEDTILNNKTLYLQD